MPLSAGGQNHFNFLQPFSKLSEDLVFQKPIGISTNLFVIFVMHRWPADCIQCRLCWRLPFSHPLLQTRPEITRETIIQRLPRRPESGFHQEISGTRTIQVRCSALQTALCSRVGFARSCAAKIICLRSGLRRSVPCSGGKTSSRYSVFSPAQ